MPQLISVSYYVALRSNGCNISVYEPHENMGGVIGTNDVSSVKLRSRTHYVEVPQPGDVWKPRCRPHVRYRHRRQGFLFGLTCRSYFTTIFLKNTHTPSGIRVRRAFKRLPSAPGARRSSGRLWCGIQKMLWRLFIADAGTQERLNVRHHERIVFTDQTDGCPG